MDVYDDFLRWAQDRGVELHGVAPRPIPGRGIGMVATKDLQPDERILHVPTAALRGLDTVRPRLRKTFPKGTRIHAILAADLALERPASKYAPWTAVIPSRESVISTLPLAWPDPALHAYLPPPARALLEKQQAKFAGDWAAVRQSSLLAKEAVTRQDFLYAWLLVNTRTFYHETARTARLPKEDRMVLQPVADLFNHADAGCEVAFTPASFAITADRSYREGDEVFICYGKHGNDFLLVEYGFVLGENQWDEVGLDDAILPELSPTQKELLDERGLLGRYVLDARTVCYRTQVALRLLCVPIEEWGRLVAEGDDGGEPLQRQVDRLLVEILRRYQGTIDGTVSELENLEAGEPCQREVLCVRWRQIRDLIERTIERLET